MTSTTRLKTNLIGGALSSTHFSVRTAMPVLLGVLGTAEGFSDRQLGAIGAAYSAGATAIALTSILWMRGTRLRGLVVTFLMVGLVALATLPAVTGYAFALSTFILAGAGFGGVYTLMVALLSGSPNPSRAFGWQWGLGSIPGILLLYGIPAVALRFDAIRATFFLMVAANAVVALAAIGLPSRFEAAARKTEGGVGERGKIIPPVWVGLFAIGAIYLGITGAWAFLGRVAADGGLPPRFSGTILAVGTATSSLVALASGQLGEIGAHRGSMTLGIAAMLVGLASVAFYPTPTGYAIGTVLFIGLATFALTFSIAIVPRLDIHGRAAGLPAAALGVGSILGPAMAGSVYQAAGSRAMLLACGLSLISGLVAYSNACGKTR